MNHSHAGCSERTSLPEPAPIRQKTPARWRKRERQASEQPRGLSPLVAREVANLSRGTASLSHARVESCASGSVDSFENSTLRRRRSRAFSARGASLSLLLCF
eukprot:6938344-Prymnesium_polylepis.1